MPKKILKFLLFLSPLLISPKNISYLNFNTTDLKLFLYSSFLSSNEEFTPKKFNDNNALILYHFYLTCNKYFSEDSKPAIKKCWDTIFNEMVLDLNYKIIYENSGHKLTEIGDPKTCKSENYTYILALLTFNLNKNETNIDNDIAIFSSKSRSNLGICIWRECDDFIKISLANEINEYFKENLKYNYDIIDIKIDISNNDIDKNYKEKLGFEICFFILLSYFIIYIFLKIIVACSVKNKDVLEDMEYEIKDGRRHHKKKNFLEMNDSIIKEEENEDENSNEDEKNSNIKNDDDENIIKTSNSNSNNKTEEEEEEDEEDEDDDEDSYAKSNEHISNDSLFNKEIEQTKIRYIENNLNKLVNNINNNEVMDKYDYDEQEGKTLNLIENVNESNESKVSKVISCLNKFNDLFLKLICIETLTGYNNNIYSNKSLEMITGLRTFTLIFMTLNLLFKNFMESPAVKQINENFFKDIFFCIIKYSSYSSFFWIYLDGFVFTYKYMNFVKKDRSFKNFLKIFLNFIPKIFVFMVIFYGIYFIQKDIGGLFGSSILFKQYVENEYNYKCINNPFYLFFPFVSKIIRDANDVTSNYYDACYPFTYLLMNEFYCACITTIIFYILYRYKSKILDIIIGALILTNILGMNLANFFIEDVHNEKYYLLKYILGETFTIRFPNMMINTFFIGVFSGLIYYYYVFSVNDLQNYLREEYFPFYYFSNLMTYIVNCNWIIKGVLIFISILLIIIDCFVPYIVFYNNENILNNFSFLLKTIYLYETPIIMIATSVLMLFFLFAEDIFQIKLFLGSKIFAIIERISFSYVCIIQMLNLFFITESNNNHGEIWTFLYFFYVACYEYMFGLFLRFILTLIFELPAKLFANFLRGKEMKQEKLN